MRAVLDLLLPPTCAGCGAEGAVLCSRCARPLLRRMDEPPGVPVGLAVPLPAGLVQLEWCSAFTGPVRDAIHVLKYRGERRLAEPLGAALAERWARAGRGGDLLVPVPIHRSRLRERGFDQADDIARACGRHLGLPVVGALERRHRTTAQHSLGRLERARNMGGAFGVREARREQIMGRWIVLVDDVSTTGVTLTGCALALHRCGRPGRLRIDRGEGAMTGTGIIEGPHLRRPMRTVIKGRHLDVPESDREYLERKMARLERLLDDRSEASVELSHEPHRDQDHASIVEVLLVLDGRPVRAVARAANHRAAADQVIDRLERQVVDLKERRDRATDRRVDVTGVEASTDRPGDDPDERQPRVVKVKRFDIEPMFEEDAVARMEELGHDFFVFVNAENEQTAVLYRRRDGDYGLIEPTVGRLLLLGSRVAARLIEGALVGVHAASRP